MNQLHDDTACVQYRSNQNDGDQELDHTIRAAIMLGLQFLASKPAFRLTRKARLLTIS